jgi:pimeloyl-ACP methyl ester carboxylesterase
VGPDRLAYQVLGQGPPDLVLTIGIFSHVDIAWDDPQTALLLRRLSSFCRLVRFDRRGTGASDPLPPGPLPPWEAYAEELIAVMDTVGSQRAALLVTGPQASAMALFFAATRAERTTALILVDATARYLAADDYPIGLPPEAAEAIVARTEELWGTEAYTGIFAPSRADDEWFWRWSARLQRAMASPRVVQAYTRTMLEVDVRSILPQVQAPTLVLHHRDLQVLPVAHGRYLASRPPATGCWPPSTGPAGRSAVRPRCGTSWARSASRSGRGCTSVRSSCAAMTSAGSPSTSPRGLWPPPAPARSSCPGPSVTWSPASRSSCRIVAASG